MTRKSPAPASSARSRAAVTTQARKKRLTRVDPKAGQSLTSLEENMLRMHHGVDAGLHTPLPTNAINAAIRQQLLEIELRAYAATGRHLQRLEEDDGEDGEAEAAEPVKARPRTAAKEKVVARLRQR